MLGHPFRHTMEKAEDFGVATGTDKQYYDHEKGPGRQRYGSAVLDAGELEV